MRKLILILLFFIPAISLAQNATITQSAQRSIEAAQFHQNLAILFVIISIFANKIIFISNYLLQTQPDINLFQLITIFFKKRKGVKLKITDQGNAPISLIKTSIVDKTDNLISTNYSDFKGMVNLAVPQDGSIIVSGFGFEKRIIKPDQIESENQITLKSVEDVSLEQGHHRSRTIAKWMLIFATVLGIYLCATISSYYPPVIVTLIIIISIVNALIILRNSSKYIVLYNSKEKLIKSNKVAICSAKGDKIKDTQTDSKGRIRAVFAPAFYIIKTPASHAKTFEIKHQIPASLKLKLN